MAGAGCSTATGGWHLADGPSTEGGCLALRATRWFAGEQFILNHEFFAICSKQKKMFTSVSVKAAKQKWVSSTFRTEFWSSFLYIWVHAESSVRGQNPGSRVKTLFQQYGNHPVLVPPHYWRSLAPCLTLFVAAAASFVAGVTRSRFSPCVPVIHHWQFQNHHSVRMSYFFVSKFKQKPWKKSTFRK